MVINKFFVYMINKGGRGKKAPYETTHIRVPLPLKRSFEDLIEQWLDLVNNGLIDPQQATQDLYKSLAFSELNAYQAIIKAAQIAKQKKSAKYSLIKLVNELYNKQFTENDLNIKTQSSKDVNK